MEVRANILNNPKGLTWDVTANLSSVANKIVKLPYNGNENNRVGGYEVATGRKKPMELLKQNGLPAVRKVVNWENWLLTNKIIYSKIGMT